MPKSMSKLLSKEGISEYKRWQVPDVSSGGSRDQHGGQNKYITAVQLEKIQKQAYEEAYSRGLREGIAAGHAQVKEKVKFFVNMANLLEKPLKDTGEETEKELVSLSLAIAKQIIRREITLDSGHIVSVIREAISALPISSQKIRIRLHPEDAEVVRTVLSDSNDEISWQLVEDPSLKRGDCKVITENSQIDASLDNRLAIIATKILGGERQSDKGNT